MKRRNGRAGEARPAFWLYAYDWLASSRVQTMTAEQEGGFIHLLCYQWTQGAALPLGRDELLRMARVADTDENWAALGEAFPENESGFGRVNPRLERERKIADRWAKMASERGRLGAQKTNAGRKGGASSAQEPRKGVASASLEVGSSSSSSSSSSRSSSTKKTRAAPARLSPDEISSAIAGVPTLDTHGFRLAFSLWLRYRDQERFRPYRPVGLQACLAQLAKIGETRAIAAIEHTMGKGWQGIREEEAQRPGAASKAAASAPYLQEYKADPEAIRMRREAAERGR